MKKLLSKFVLGMLIIGILGGCAGFSTTPLTDEQRFGPTNKALI